MTYNEVVEFITVNTERKYHKDITLKFLEIEKSNKIKDFLYYFDKENNIKTPYETLVSFYLDMDKK